MQFIDLKSQYAALQTAIDGRMRAVLEHGQYIMGPEVRELEERLAAYTGTPHCITVASGTEALLIALMAIGVRPGDEVITTPFSFFATAEVIALLGATPVFVDVEPDTCNIDVSRIEAAVTARSRAIIPVSLYGQPADMEAINAIAERHGLVVIEDAAQSFGADYRGKKSCNLSAIGCTSFFPSKPLGCYGDGGAIFTHDDGLAQAMREIRVHGQSKRYHHARIGVGGRMDTLQCAIVLAKLERFAWEIERRIALGKRYGELLADCAGIRTLALRPDRSSVHGQYTVLCEDRAAAIARMTAAAIPHAVHYPIALHRQPALADLGYGEGSFPIAERLAQQVLSLPMSADLNEAEQVAVVRALRGSDASAGGA